MVNLTRVLGLVQDLLSMETTTFSLILKGDKFSLLCSFSIFIVNVRGGFVVVTEYFDLTSNKCQSSCPAHSSALL